jgi:hypothetical protein
MNACPYCQNNFPLPLKRKGTCPNCQKTIFVRNGQMITEYDYKKFNWLNRVAIFDVDETFFDSSRIKLKQKFSTEPLFNDVCWSILNKLLEKYAGDAQHSRMVYLEMAYILELEGKDNKETIIRAYRNELIEWKRLKNKNVFALTANDDHVCEECKKMSTEKIPIDLAIETNPIPNRCKNKYCRCSYGTYFDLD